MARCPGYPYTDMGNVGFGGPEMGGLGGFSLKKVFKKAVSLVKSAPKRVASAVKLSVMAPLQFQKALVTHGFGGEKGLTAVVGKVVTEAYRTGALPGITKEKAFQIGVSLIPGVGAGTALAIQSALLAGQLLAQRQQMKQATKEAESQYGAQLNNAYKAYTMEAKAKGVQVISFDSFKRYVETGSL